MSCNIWQYVFVHMCIQTYACQILSIAYFGWPTKQVIFVLFWHDCKSILPLAKSTGYFAFFCIKQIRKTDEESLGVFFVFILFKNIPWLCWHCWSGLVFYELLWFYNLLNVGLPLASEKNNNATEMFES